MGVCRIAETLQGSLRVSPGPGEPTTTARASIMAGEAAGDPMAMISSMIEEGNAGEQEVGW
jgi:hypothetical protein